MSEEKNDYGDLYDGELFEKLFPHFNDHQKKAAEDLSRRILGRCGVDSGMPAIDWIIDLGCGEGSLTIELAKLRSASDTKFIGIDCSSKAIAGALQKASGVPNVRFQQCTDNFTDFFNTLEVEWGRTALVCLSHTWFHLPQNDILKAVQTHRPALLVIDFFHTWDATITKIANSDCNGELEFGRSLNEERNPKRKSTYWLRTVKSKDEGKVTRGLWKEVAASDPEAGSSGDWQFKTEQHALTTGDLFGKAPVEGEVRKLDEAHRHGTITSENGCDYIVRKQIHHSSGWGQMQTFALVPRDKWAKHINPCYFAVIKKIVHRIFISDESKASHEYLRSLLNLYNEPVAWSNATGFAGSRDASITLPFDPHTNFARIIGLFPNCKDEEIAKHDLILETPTDEQIRFPTAYGLFHTSEGRTSSPQAFPLKWAPDYEHAWVDEEFAKLENKLLGITDADGNEIKQDKELGYFLLPIYFGSLPLFTLVLRFPSVFPPQSTDFQVYFSTLSNLHSEIKVALDDDFIRTELLRPWIAAALDALDACKEEMPLAEKVGILEKMLFGSVTESDGPRNYKVAGIMRDGGVLGKDWKSWVLGIPSYPIKKLRSVEAENTRLWNLWEQEKKRVLLDPDLLISSWFQAGDFFAPLDGTDDGPHDNWECKTHLPRLRRMFELVGIQCATQLSTIDDSWLGTAISKLESDSCNPAVERYFGRVHAHFLFTWMMDQFKLLESTKPSCQFRDQCEPQAAADNAKCSRNEVFLRLKSVFCKSLGNTGERVRFGLQRLHCLLSAALFRSGVTLDVTSIKKITLGQIVESKFWSIDDPSMCLAAFIAALRPLKKLKSVKIECLRRATKASICITGALSANGGGSECDRVKKSFDALLLMHNQNVLRIEPTTWSDTDEFQIMFEVAWIDAGIEITKG